MILLVSDEPTLLVTRAAMLAEWQCKTASFSDAADVTRAHPYDLIIFCQTVPESLAIELLAMARTENEAVKVLTILSAGGTPHRSFESESYTVDFAYPGRLRDAVARLVPSPAFAGN